MARNSSAKFLTVVTEERRDISMLYPTPSPCPDAVPSPCP